MHKPSPADDLPEVGDPVRLTDTSEGVITSVIVDTHGVPVMVVVCDSEHRWHDIPVSELYRKPPDA